MVGTRSGSRDAAGQPACTSGANPVQPPVLNMPISGVTIPATTTGNGPPPSSLAPPIDPVMEEVSRMLSSSFRSQDSIAPPSFSSLTGLNAPARPVDPAMGSAMREIINSAVGLARAEFEREQAESIRRLIPTIVEATRRSLGVGGISARGNIPVEAPFPAAPPVQGPPIIPPVSRAQTAPHPLNTARPILGFSQPPPSISAPRISSYIPPPSLDPRSQASAHREVNRMANEGAAFMDPPIQQQFPGHVEYPAAQGSSGLEQGPAGHNFAHHMPPGQNVEFPPPNHSQRGSARRSTTQNPENAARITLAKWGVKFDGTTKTMNVHEFIFRVGELKRDYECPDEDFITKFHQLLESPALDWYWGHRKFVQFRDWNELQTALLNQYQRFENEFQVQTQMLNRRQLPHESFEDFYNAVMQLRTQQKAPYSEDEMVEIMRGNLKSSLAQMIFSARISNLGEFYREVKRAENLIASHRQQYSRPGPPQRVHELAWEEALPPEILEVDAIQDRTKIKCWNCEAEGHSWNTDRPKAIAVPQRELKPLHVRIKEYKEARTRIFGTVSNKIRKARERYKARKRLRQHIAAATLYEGEDTRFYTKISINGQPIEGLLDSGATVSCLGKGCEDFVDKAGLEVSPFVSVIQTADGTPHRIKGRVSAAINFNKRECAVTFYLVPSLRRELFLGVDFMRSFNLFAGVDSLSTNDIGLCGDADDRTDDEIKLHSLTDQQRKRLNVVMEMFPCYTKKGLGKTSIEVHTIDTRDACPVKDRHYPVSPAVQRLMYAELDRMLSLGVIEESESPWSHPVTLVRKGEKNRLCLDARKLNALTVKDAYPLPHIEGLLSRLGDTYFISSVDLKDAFWQIPLDHASREKTAFTVPGRPLYHFKVMPFGLCNAAQRLCRLMDRVIPAALRDRVFVYLDDLLVVSPDFDTHMGLLERVANCLSNAGLTINVAKSKFCFKELRYLGYIVGGGKLKPDPERISTIMKFCYPRTAKQVRSFMGTTGWYRRFIADYATIAAPIFNTLKKGKQFNFPEDAKEAFNKLKEALVTSPVLTHPDFTRHFYVQCDASDLGIGAVLFQRDDSGGEHPIAYFSHKLTSAQRNYSVTERECLAVVMAIKRFRPYIELLPFSVITDHSSLKWLMSHRDLSGRLARWSLHLQSFSFEIEHRPGSQNIVPDTLSRYSMEEVAMDVSSFVDLESSAFSTESYMDLVAKVKDTSAQLPDLRVVDGLVYKRTQHDDGIPLNEDFAWKLWVPMELTRDIIRKAHCPPQVSHGGFHKTLRRVKEYFYWPNLNTQVRQFVQECQTCKETKPSNTTLRPPMGKECVTERPFQRIYVDFLGPYPRSKSGNTFIFIVLDHLSKYVLLKAMPKASTRNVVRFLISEVFHKFGTPETLVSDNGKQFVSKEFAELVRNFGINHA
ncbi:uncharacterized protein LOC131996064 [Stomoxys calcitrans]|uniref:uncharacterized protein LOC131996064 n=1 Tax=Stomoxys calcitrans TaxID=35570 RepID=UPI0027E2895F|nr:uncharacterized protein LOC131996064 [Stomoxys calcitrans]